jgi:phage terminase large subunit
MTTLRIETAPVFEPLLRPARYKGAYGGRGSGKSYFFAELLIEDHLLEPGMASICIREVQKDLKQSSKRLIEKTLERLGLGEADGFKAYRDVIRTPGDGVISFQGMQEHTKESIKSLEGYKRAWVEEAQTLSAGSLNLLTPTIRVKDSQIWFSWNPTRKSDPVDMMFRGGKPPTDSIVVRANWSDNPWFKDTELVQDRLDCLNNQPDQYAHTWEGDYATVLTGAYYAQCLQEARAAGRIGKVAKDPLMQIRAFWDIGYNDATAIWVAQFVGREIRVLDYYEAQGQPLAAHLNWLRSRGYDNVQCVLPHDGANHSTVTGSRYVEHVREAGFDAETVPNMGRGADLRRIEAARRLFPSIWFNQDSTQPGLDALGWYHEKRDEARNIGLGPDHDWSSHGADAFGLMCVAYEAPQEKRKAVQRHMAPMGWMG